MTIDELIEREISQDVFQRWLDASWHKGWIVSQALSRDPDLVEAAVTDAIEDYRAHRLMDPGFIAELRERNADESEMNRRAA